jgi:hypothetical protein
VLEDKFAFFKIIGKLGSNPTRSRRCIGIIIFYISLFIINGKIEYCVLIPKSEDLPRYTNPTHIVTKDNWCR